MGLFLGYESAVRYWLTKTGDECMPDPAPDLTLSHAEASSRAVKGAALPFDVSADQPLHVMVPNRSSCRSLICAKTHVWSLPLPPGSFMQLGGTARVSCPELTFVQMASSLPEVELIELGSYLCGVFAVSEDGSGYAGQREQLTSTELIGSYLARLAPRTQGARKARLALSYIVDRAASPFEVFYAMNYRMPRRLGGRHELTILANQPIALDPPIQRLLGKERLIGDLTLPDQNADLEYDSYEFHTGRYRLDHTQARRNALEAMGIKTISATYGQMNTIDKFDNFTWMLEKRLGLEHPVYSTAERQAQIDLYNLLLSRARRLF